VGQLFIILSGLAIAVGYIDFIKGTIHGTVIPNRASWIVWFVQDCLLATSALFAGIGPAAVMPVVWGSGAAIMLVLCFKKGTHTPFTVLEKACLFLSGLGIILWATSGSPQLAMITGVSASCIGGIPTLMKAWARPETEPMNGWFLMIIGTLFSSLAIKEWTFDSGFLPVTIGIFQFAVFLPLILHTFTKRDEYVL